MGSRRDSGQPFMILRYMSHRTLADAIREYHTNGSGSADFFRLLDGFLAACDALSFAHSRGVIHRDPKPSNILFGAHGQVVLADWGLARAEGEPEPQPSGGQPPLNEPGLTHENAVLGTPAYMSPEQYRGDAVSSGPRMDIYGLGAVLFEILTGERVHGDASRVEIGDRFSRGLIRTPRSLNPTVPRALEAICLRAVRYNPAERYSSVASLAQEVRAWVQTTGVRAPTSRVSEQGKRAQRRWLGRPPSVPASKVSLGR